MDFIELGNCTFTPVVDEYIYVKDVFIVLFILYLLYYEVCSWKMYVFSFYPRKSGGC